MSLIRPPLRMLTLSRTPPPFGASGIGRFASLTKNSRLEAPAPAVVVSNAIAASAAATAIAETHNCLRFKRPSPGFELAAADARSGPGYGQPQYSDCAGSSAAHRRE